MEELYIEAYSNNINIIEEYNEYFKFKAMLYKNLIILNDFFLVSNIDKKCNLAHELGHFFTDFYYINYTDNSYFNSLIESRNESRAERWAIVKLISKDALMEQIELGLNVFEIAENLEVTEDLVRKAYELYKNV
ncbi:MAG: ImmA/IrrE family metallo-endopeptidase [Clostridia bacterium]